MRIRMLDAGGAAGRGNRMAEVSFVAGTRRRRWMIYLRLRCEIHPETPMLNLLDVTILLPYCVLQVTPYVVNDK